MKQILDNYSVSGNTVTLTGVNRPKSAILLITDTASGSILYSAQTGGASAYTQGTNSTITLTSTPGSMLQIFYDDGATETPVTTPLPSSPVSGQVKIATSGTAVQLPSRSLENGVVIKARSQNAGNGFVGASGVTTTDDGTGNGYRIEPGEAVSYACPNTNGVWVNGTAGDIFYFTGN